MNPDQKEEWITQLIAVPVGLAVVWLLIQAIFLIGSGDPTFVLEGGELAITKGAILILVLAVAAFAASFASNKNR